MNNFELNRTQIAFGSRLFSIPKAADNQSMKLLRKMATYRNCDKPQKKKERKKKKRKVSGTVHTSSCE